MSSNLKFSTKVVHAGQPTDTRFGSVVDPIYQTSTFAWNGFDDPPPHDYSRSGHPNSAHLESALMELTSAKFAVATGSGMAAIAGSLAFLKSGDHLLLAESIYGGTFNYVYRELTRQGISVTPFNSLDPKSWENLPDANAAIFESPTNPLLDIVPIQELVSALKKKNIISIFDNTFASPSLQNSLSLGVTLEIHSTTKYIGGHSDFIGGVILTNDETLGARARSFVTAVGAQAPPFDSWLALRGLKTLDLRIEKHCKNAQKVAEFLADHHQVESVYYPGLKNHPGHELAESQMSGMGGMMSFKVKGGPSNAEKVALGCKIFRLAASLGGVESLIGYPWRMSHRLLPEEERLARGITPNLLRVSVGIEDGDDLCEDLRQSLALI